MGGGPLILGQRTQVVSLAAQHALPASYTTRQYTDVGGLMSYGPSSNQRLPASRYLRRPHRQGCTANRSAGHAATKFDMIINLKTAKALGLDVPPTLLARADEVIE